MQAVTTNELFKIYESNYFPMEWVTPIVVPKKNEIFLGEKYSADVYLAGGSQTNKYLVILNNDTLKYSNDSICPIYEETPTTKGEKILIGTIQVYHPGLKSNFKYNFTTKYIVK